MTFAALRLYGFAPDAAIDRPFDSGVVSAAEPDVLMEILDPRIGMAVWDRAASSPGGMPVSPHGPDWLADISDRPDQVPAALGRCWPGRLPAWLAADAGRLAGLLAALAGSRAVRLRLRRGEDPRPECPPASGLALVCRYAGSPLAVRREGRPLPEAWLDPHAVGLIRAPHLLFAGNAAGDLTLTIHALETATP
ncbi:hypothetical protein [Rhizosaccharibacter radicis]|uniref:Uncharacterized protein n=1 Tax=Rhizosaccharibacter radicis TaxID=2782605 RepID=A0ABT1W0I3_9PROT|nr:hypothetical protein [Acetobacteraceae bacterium KSS12]